jgi:hypothetical protein
MNKKRLFILLFMALGTIFFVQAQNCPEEPAQKKGVWKNYPDDGLDGFELHPVTMKYKAQIGHELDSIVKLFIKYNPAPTGSEAKWKRSLRTEWDSLTSPDPSFTNYMYTGGYFPYICSNGVVKAFSQTDTWVYVHVNGFWCSGYTIQHEINNALGEKLFTLPPQRAMLKGYPVFEPIPKGETDSPWLVFYSVLIHKPGKLPYTTVTKREFFDLYKRLVDASEKKELYSYDIKNASAYQIKNNGEDWYRIQSERVKKKYQDINNNLRKLEKVNEKEMDQPAILRGWDCTVRTIEIANPEQNDLFTTAASGFQLVRANPSYMDRKQEKWKPQFIWVEWQKVVGLQNSAELDKVMREKFDFTKLGDLLTK